MMAETPLPSQVSVWNIANGLTFARIVLVPVYGWLLLHDAGQSPLWRWAAVGVFVVAMVTDRIDGHVARSRGLVTDVGKLADPIADKALTGMAFVGLSLLGMVWWWVTVAVLVREWGITLLRLAVARNVVVPAGAGGKLKTALQAVALTLYTAPVTGIAAWAAAAVMVAAVVVTLVTGITYLAQLLPLLAGSGRGNRKGRRGGGAGGGLP